MKILQFGKYYYPVFGGMERAMYEIVEGFNARGVKCDVLCSNTKMQNEISDFGNYKVYRAASFGLLNSTPISPQLISTLWRVRKEYDVIQVHHPDPLAFLALFVVRPSCKIVVQWQSDIVRQEKMLKLFLPLQNWVLNRADAIIAASRAYAEHSPYLIPHLDKTEIIPIGISEDGLQANKGSVEKIRADYGDKKIVLALGRLVSYKGFDYLVKAARYLSDDYLLLIAGNGPEKKNLEALITHYQLEKKVHLLGNVDEEKKYDYYQAASLFCLPSVTKAEAYGIVLVEAMAFGKPIISSRIPESGMAWVNQDRVTGIQVPPRSSRELARAIEEIGDDPIRYREFSENAKKRYRKFFTRDKMINKLDTLYQKLLKKVEKR